jgi:hypothetical protein
MYILVLVVALYDRKIITKRGKMKRKTVKDYYITATIDEQPWKVLRFGGKSHGRESIYEGNTYLRKFDPNHDGLLLISGDSKALHLVIGVYL